MSRLTQAQQIQREQHEQALAFFEKALAPLPDRRRAQGKRYPLRTVIVTALNPEAFSAVFRAWMSEAGLVLGQRKTTAVWRSEA